MPPVIYKSYKFYNSERYSKILDKIILLNIINKRILKYKPPIMYANECRIGHKRSVIPLSNPASAHRYADGVVPRFVTWVANNQISIGIVPSPVTTLIATNFNSTSTLLQVIRFYCCSAVVRGFVCRQISCNKKLYKLTRVICTRTYVTIYFEYNKCKLKIFHGYPRYIVFIIIKIVMF